MRIVISAIIHYKVNFLGFKWPNFYTLPPTYVSETHTKNLGRFNKEKLQSFNAHIVIINKIYYYFLPFESVALYIYIYI